ncbi:MAG: FAD-dependent oxidoreductase, partial [Oscillospiraceae bacterium]
SRGLKIRLNESISGFSENNGVLLTELKDKPPVESDLVILAIGVVPETHLAKEAGLVLGAKESIAVNEHMQTSEPDIYAVGDAVEVRHFVTGSKALIALAGPANKQGRIAADNICGIPSKFSGSQGSSVIKLFDMTAASTGINEKTAKAEGIAYDKAVTYSASHATYYPGSTDLTIKTVFDAASGKILGAQIVGFDGVDKRIDVLATAIHAGMTAAQLAELDLAYAPPYSSAKDPVNMAGFVIENARSGLMKQYHWHDIEKLQNDGEVTMLDTRTEEEYAEGHIEGTVNIPLNSLRERIDELDKAKRIYVNCYSGLRSYIACRILTGHGFNCYNLSGGYRFYELIT